MGCRCAADRAPLAQSLQTRAGRAGVSPYCAAVLG